MAQSLSKLYIHLVFHIHSQSVSIRESDQKELYRYIGSIIMDNDSIPIAINGTENHLHILCVMSKNIALAKLVEEIKRHSSRWIKTLNKRYQHFKWQGGYAGFSISQSLHDKTRDYIINQEEHHKKMTFREELLAFLREYGVSYNEQYLLTD